MLQEPVFSRPLQKHHYNAQKWMGILFTFLKETNIKDAIVSLHTILPVYLESKLHYKSLKGKNHIFRSRHLHEHVAGVPRAPVE